MSAETEFVPDRIVLSGDGLRLMTSGHYQTFVKNLGRMGIDISMVDALDETEDSPEPLEESERVTREKLQQFADSNGYSETLVDRVWGGLLRTYLLKRGFDIERRQGKELYQSISDLKKEQCPIEFEEIDFYRTRGSVTPRNELLAARLSSVEMTVQWLFGEGGYTEGRIPIDQFGVRSLSFLAHYVNDTIQPDEPYVVKFDTDGRDEYPPEEIRSAEHEVDLDSPYLESVEVDGTMTKVVSTKAIREYCETIGIASSRTANIIGFIEALVRKLDPRLEGRLNTTQPERMSDDVIYLKTKRTNGYFRSSRQEWGIDPVKFVQLMREHQAGQISIDHMSDFTTFLVTNYANAILVKNEEASESETT